jgi:hypothetical protein
MKNFKEENLASKFISVETLLFSGIFRWRVGGRNFCGWDRFPTRQAKRRYQVRELAVSRQQLCWSNGAKYRQVSGREITCKEDSNVLQWLKRYRGSKGGGG